jgi:tripartite-type tricarboxylate transporter receptor subunit TctC
MMITDMATGLPQVKGGKVRALGVSTAKRSPLSPELPTISEAGLKGYEMSFWFAAYVPGQHAGRNRQPAARRARRSHQGPGHAAVLRRTREPILS